MTRALAVAILVLLCCVSLADARPDRHERNGRKKHHEADRTEMHKKSPRVKECSFVGLDGSVYDLSRLAKKDEPFKYEDDKRSLSLAICRSMSPEESPCSGADTAVCVEAKNGTASAVSAGRWPNVTLAELPRLLGAHESGKRVKKGVQLTISNGDVCPSGERMHTTVNLVCSHGHKMKIKSVIADDCTVIVSAKSKAACPRRAPRSDRDHDDDDDDEDGEAEGWVIAASVCIGLFICVNCCLICVYCSRRRQAAQRATTAAAKDEYPGTVYVAVPEVPTGQATAAPAPLPNTSMYPDLNQPMAMTQAQSSYVMAPHGAVFQARQPFVYPAFFGGIQYPMQPMVQATPTTQQPAPHAAPRAGNVTNDSSLI